jgi:hypothetical protein
MVFLKILTDVLSFLIRSCRLAPRFLMLLLYSGPFCLLFLILGPLWLHTLGRAGRARRVIPSPGGGQLLLVLGMALGPFLRLSTEPYDEMSVPRPVLECYHSFHCGLLFTGFISSGFASIFSGKASVASRRAFITFHEAFISAIIYSWPAFISVSSRSINCSVTSLFVL